MRFDRLQPFGTVGRLVDIMPVHAQQRGGVHPCRHRIIHHHRGDPPVALQPLYQPHQVIDAARRVLQHVIDDLLLQHPFAQVLVVDATDHHRGQPA